MSTALQPHPPAQAPAPLKPARPLRRRSTAHALRLTQAPRAVRFIGYALFAAFLVLPFLLALVPWRQSVSGYGTVIAFDPLERPYTVDSPIYGRVTEVFVTENQFVRAGERIARVQDIDSGYLDTLKQQLDFAERGRDLAQLSVTAYEAVRTQAENERVQNNLEADAAVDAATQKIAEVEAKIAEIEAEVAAYRYKLELSQGLYERGLEAQEKLVEAQRNYAGAVQKLEQARAALEQAKQAKAGYEAKRDATAAKGLALVQKADADTQTAQGKLQDELTKIGDLQVKVRRQETQYVSAPRAGYVFRIHTNVGAGAQVKDGDPIATIVPKTTRLAAEIYVPGRDVPLVRVNDPVRLQFDGWPAVQFMGWPSVAVGTFPGRVAVIDQAQSKGGNFRILVVPEPIKKGVDQPPYPASQSPWGRDEDGWPSDRFLRQGAGARGWILLQEVPLGFEVWRRLNGFPPTVAEPDPTADPKGAPQDAGPPKEDKEIKVKRPK